MLIEVPGMRGLSPTLISFAVFCLMGGIVLTHGMVPASFFGLLVFALIQWLSAPIGRALGMGRSRLIALILVALLVILGTGLLTASLIHHILDADWPALFDRLGIALMSLREDIPERYAEALPADATGVLLRLADLARDHAGALSDVGLMGLKSAALMLIAAVIAALLAIEGTPANASPLGQAFFERAARLSRSFQKILGAQAKIAVINTLLTALYLWAALPLFGIRLQHSDVLVLGTLITAFIPVVGNLLSNTAIVLLSFMVSPQLAISSLVFLLVIHKLEYFLNAKIVGKEVNCSSWELLLAMVFMESLFGVSGIIAAPILYSWIKSELQYLQYK